MRLNYIEAINYLYSLQRFGIKLGLHNIERSLKLAQNPERNFISIHIAGTNGKGSTSSFIASVLAEQGFKVGLYTSPHLVDFTERIKINGVPIPREKVVEYLNFFVDEVNQIRATFFETTTAIAFKYFADEKVDFAVIETGLGGRLDSTNVIKPAISIITNVSYDHMDVLGDTIEKIAFEKAGIIKQGVPCITGATTPEAIDVIKKVAEERNSEILFANEILNWHIKDEDIGSTTIDLKTPLNFYKNLIIGLAGKHQIANAGLSVLCYEKLSELGFFEYNRNVVYDGLLKVRENTGIRGRLEILRRNPTVVIDVAHNFPAIEIVVDEIKKFQRKNLYIIFGVMKDKEYEKMISKLSEVADFAIATQPKIGRALDSKTIAKIFTEKGVKAVSIPDSDKAFDFAFSKVDDEDLIFIVGSHYLAGEIIAHIEGRKIEALI